MPLPQDLIVDGYKNMWFICYPDGSIYSLKYYSSSKGAKIALSYLKRKY